jgi:50S ribosome-binding GTPase/Domain of unknown function (DUF3482)
MVTLSLSLVSHTNVGKTSLARTLLGRDVGEVRDAPHVTELAEPHLLVETPGGDRLTLWDTPGFGDSVRLARRMRQQGRPLGWLLSEVWDRWRDRPFWASQQALRHVRDDSDVVLYLVNAAESPHGAGYVAPEMELLGWVGKPVIVLLNQLGAARSADEDAADIQAWRAHLAAHGLVKAVLPLDAFSRCWLQEGLLLLQIGDVLAGDAAAAMARLHAAWAQARLATFSSSMALLADGLGRAAAARVTVGDAGGLRERLRQVGGALGLPGASRDADPQVIAQQALAALLADDSRDGSTRLIRLHGLDGQAQAQIEALLDQPFEHRQKLPEGKAAVIGGAVTGALTGLKADVLSGGLTLGGGLIAGGLLGALGAASLARGINVVRGRGSSWVAWNDEALDALVEAALMRYLAVAHFGRGRGAWTAGEPPAHWRAAVQQALAPHADALAAVWRGRSTRHDAPDDPQQLAAALQPLLHGAARGVLDRLYPGAWPQRADPPQSPP